MSDGTILTHAHPLSSMVVTRMWEKLSGLFMTWGQNHATRWSFAKTCGLKSGGKSWIESHPRYPQHYSYLHPFLKDILMNIVGRYSGCEYP